MIKLTLAIILTLLLTVAMFWLGQNSGIVTFTVFEYVVETQVVYAFIALILIITFSHILIVLISNLISLPSYFKQYSDNSKRILKEKLLVGIIKNFYLQDINALKKNVKELKVLKIDEAVKDITWSFYSKFSSNLAEYKASLILLNKYDLLKKKSQENLFEIAIIEEDWLLASELSRQLYKEKANYLSAKNFILAHFYAQKNNELLQFLKQFKFVNEISKESRKEIQSVIYFKLAEKELSFSNISEAESFLKYSIDLCPEFIPSIKALFDIKYQKSEYAEAFDILKKAWKFCPNQHYNKMFLKLRNHFSSEEYYKMIRKAVSYYPEHLESNLLLGEAALICDQYDISLQEISKVLETAHHKRAALLMAKFCLMTHANVPEVLEWLRQSFEAVEEDDNNKFYLDFGGLKISKVAPHLGSLIAKI